jgi:hypothetical protein
MNSSLKPNLLLKSVTWSVFLGSIISKRTLAFSSHTKIKMQAVRSDGIGGRGVTYIPSSGSYKNVVVWMHGLGDTADGWAAMMPTLGLSDTKFVLPTATNLPITINGGMAMPGTNLCFQSPSLIFLIIFK